MKFTSIAFATLAVISSVIAGPSTKATYTDQKVIQFKTNAKINPVLDQIDVWAQTEDSVSARVTPSQLASLKKANGGSLEYKTLIEDLQSQIYDSFSQIESKTASADWFSNYHTYEDIKTWYSTLASSNSDAVKFVPSIGKTNQGRDLFAVHITNPTNTPKKKVYFESLIHAREWITGSTLQYVLNHLITNRQSDPAIKSLLDQIEIIAVPVVNPDGYAYTWSGDRLWRKNRRSVTGGVGIDLNRNFPYGWGGAGASTSPSSETYRGPSAASESETQAIVNYFKSQGPFLGAIDFHSYSQLILRPYGTTQTLSPHEAQHKALGEDIKQKIADVAGTSYINERSIDLYACSGTASDWFYAGNNQKTYGYTIELSPDADDPNGFVLPPESIIPVAQDITPAVIYFLETVLSNPL